jgi:hypothetical protein
VYQVIGGGVPSKSIYAKLQVENTIKACLSYQSIYGKYPNDLAALVGIDGERPFLEGGEKAVYDPWGNPLKYALVPDAKGNMEPYVWSERTVDGKLAIIGAKKANDKDMQFFGQ